MSGSAMNVEPVWDSPFPPLSPSSLLVCSLSLPLSEIQRKKEKELWLLEEMSIPEKLTMQEGWTVVQFPESLKQVKMVQEFENKITPTPSWVLSFRNSVTASLIETLLQASWYIQRNSKTYHKWHELWNLKWESHEGFGPAHEGKKIKVGGA